MNRDYDFTFGDFPTRLHIGTEIPVADTLRDSTAAETAAGLLFVCDTHTEPIAEQIMQGRDFPRCVLLPGEEAKGWASAEAILGKAREAGLGRDGLFIGVGGGVVCDLTAFAASVYMRGAGLCLVPTTLLAMVDAALGGKTGFDLFGIKNLAGTFYPARYVSIPLGSLATLPQHEWKSGFAELIKTAVLDTGADSLPQSDSSSMFTRIQEGAGKSLRETFFTGETEGLLFSLVSRAAEIKGRIVEADPRETGTERALLNLGHTFGHALEAAAGLGAVSHGEAVAWGMVRACELGETLGITPRDRGDAIIALIRSYGYETAAPHPLIRDKQLFIKALGGDKKKKAGKSVFVVPAEKGAKLVTADGKEALLEQIINGGYIY
ncbi:MAG: 3-dehydroquinate synthase [Spirochaetaceae bacterium]|jgi:3-dehydroquinate synthase|nr:3-dehydroquinate synthase [Spirochaetaceae bacterium]